MKVLSFEIGKGVRREPLIFNFPQTYVSNYESYNNTVYANLLDTQKLPM